LDRTLCGCKDFEGRLNTAIYKALINANIPTPCSDVRIQMADQENREIISRQDNELSN
jgi:hypothetical protein